MGRISLARNICASNTKHVPDKLTWAIGAANTIQNLERDLGAVVADKQVCHKERAIKALVPRFVIDASGATAIECGPIGGLSLTQQQVGQNAPLVQYVLVYSSPNARGTK